MAAVFQQRISAAFLAGAAFFCMARSSSAAPREWKASEGGNGHFYEFVYEDRSATWDTARVDAEGRTFVGVHGHLATITSPGEQSFVGALPYIQLVNPYLGGIQATGSTERDQGWSWITGEAWDFTFWATNPTQPDDFPNNVFFPIESGNEQHLSLLPPENNSGWNDIDGRLARSNSYLVEFDVPEPSSAALLATVALAMSRRRRR